MIRMKKYNKLIFILVFLSFISIVSISSATAINLDGSSFTDLDNAIQANNNGEIVLQSDVSLSSFEASKYSEGITINNTITIDGNNHKISALSNNVFNVKDGGSLTLKNINIINSGGYAEVHAISVDQSSLLNLYNVNFIDNIGVEGSCIYNNGFATVKNCVFDSNTALLSSSAIYQNNILAQISVDNCTFTNNKRSAIYINLGSALISNSNFMDNDGGINVVTANVTVTNNRFINNKGTAIYVVLGKLRATSNLFINNGKVAIEDLDANEYEYNVFLNSPQGKAIICNGGKVNNNYLGSNDPVLDGVVVGTTPTNNVELRVIGEDGVDFNSLNIYEPTYVTIQYMGDNLDKLPSFIANIEVTPKRSIMINNNKVIIGKDPVKIDIIPTKSSNGSLIVSSELNNVLTKFDYHVNYIDLKNYTLDIDYDQTINYGDDLVINVKLTDENNNPVSGIINVKIDNKNYQLNLNANGEDSILIKNLKTGKYDIEIEYLTSNYYYDDIELTKTVNVVKSTITPIINVENIKKGETAHISVDLLKPITGEVNIVITSENKAVKVKVIDGKASADFNGLSVGKKTVWVYSLENEYYYAFDVYSSFKVSPSDDGGSVKPPIIPDNPTDPGDSGADEGGSGSTNPGTDEGSGSSSGSGGSIIPGIDDGSSSGNPTDSSGDNTPSNPDASNGNNNENTNGSGTKTDSPSSSQDSDEINSKDSNSQQEAATVGAANFNINSQAGSTQGPSDSGQSKNAYELDKKSKENVSKNISVIPSFAVGLISIFLLAIGYKKKY